MSADDLTTRDTDPDGARGGSSLSRLRKLAFGLAVVVGVLLTLEVSSRFLVNASANGRWSAHSRLVAGLGFPALNDILIEDDHAFWTLAPDLDGLELAGRFADGAALRFTVTTDRRGLRKMPPVIDAAHRIVFLGDSCTFGLGVDDEQTFPAEIQRAIPGAECVNLAVPGYTAFQGRRVFERFSFDGRVDVVVITFGRNDDLKWDGRSDIEHAVMLEDQRSSLLRHSRAARLIGEALGGLTRKEASSAGGMRPRLTDDEFVEQIRAMIRYCRRIGATPVLVVWPLRVQLTREGMTAKQIAVVRTARIEHVPLVNLLPAFRAHADTPGLIIDVVHAGPPGCSLVARTLVPVIEEALTARSSDR